MHMGLGMRPGPANDGIGRPPGKTHGSALYDPYLTLYLPLLVRKTAAPGAWGGFFQFEGVRDLRRAPPVTNDGFGCVMRWGTEAVKRGRL